MTTPYDEMWEKLNLDLTAHEGLLQVLGKFYGDIYLTQEGRLQGMEYLDFVLSEVHGLRIKELQEAKAQGRKVIGTFCAAGPAGWNVSPRRSGCGRTWPGRRSGSRSRCWSVRPAGPSWRRRCAGRSITPPSASWSPPTRAT